MHDLCEAQRQTRDAEPSWHLLSFKSGLSFHAFQTPDTNELEDWCWPRNFVALTVEATCYWFIWEECKVWENTFVFLNDHIKYVVRVIRQVSNLLHLIIFSDDSKQVLEITANVSVGGNNNNSEVGSIHCQSATTQKPTGISQINICGRITTSIKRLTIVWVVLFSINLRTVTFISCWKVEVEAYW